MRPATEVQFLDDGGVLLPRGLDNYPTEIAVPLAWRKHFGWLVSNLMQLGATPQAWGRDTKSTRLQVGLPVRVALMPTSDHADDILVFALDDGGAPRHDKPIGYAEFKHYKDNYSDLVHQLVDWVDAPITCWAMITEYAIYPEVLELAKANIDKDWGDLGRWELVWLDKGLVPRRQAVELGLQAESFHLDLLPSKELQVEVERWVRRTPPKTKSVSHSVAMLDLTTSSACESRMFSEPGPIAVGTRKSGLVLTRSGGVEVGRVVNGVLCDVLDERIRPQLTRLAEAAGVTVKQSKSEVEGLPRALLHAADLAPDLFTIHAIVPGVPVDSLPIVGTYRANVSRLNAWSEAHLDPLQRLVRRHGFGVDSAVVATSPAGITMHNIQSAAVTSAGVVRDSPMYVRPELQGMLPEEHTSWLDATWQVADQDFRDREAYAPQNLLHTVYESRPVVDVQCALCGVMQPFMRNHNLCTRCFLYVQHGRLADTGVDGGWTETVIWALRELHELGVLKHTRKYLAEARPKTPRELLLWTFIPRTTKLLPEATRPARDWVHWLNQAGLFDGHRTIMGVVSIANDGHACRSLLERDIDDFLFANGIVHEVEPYYPHHRRLNPNGLRADWLLPDGTFVEALGLMNRPAYVAQVERKRKLVKKLNLKMIEIEPHEAGNLKEVFAQWISP